jgi:hypothetical protein
MALPPTTFPSMGKAEAILGETKRENVRIKIFLSIFLSLKIPYKGQVFHRVRMNWATRQNKLDDERKRLFLQGIFYFQVSSLGKCFSKMDKNTKTMSENAKLG